MRMTRSFRLAWRQTTRRHGRQCTWQKKAAEAVAKSEALPKAEEVLRQLKVKERYGVMARPAAPSDAAGLGAFFGISGEVTFASALSLRTGWTARNQQRRLPVSAPAPKVVYAYWRGLEATCPLLSATACDALLQPLRSACVERVFSVLTNIDEPTRQTMERDLLYTTLFLRANAPVVRDLVEQRAHMLREWDGPKPGEKRKREAEATIRAAVAQAADMLNVNEAAHAGGAQAGGAQAGKKPSKHRAPVGKGAFAAKKPAVPAAGRAGGGAAGAAAGPLPAAFKQQLLDGEGKAEMGDDDWQ